jgi:transcriptional regulator with PAS, ATPase and Fis domain
VLDSHGLSASIRTAEPSINFLRNYLTNKEIKMKTLVEQLLKAEKQIIKGAVKKYGTRGEAAEALGISRRTLIRKAHTFGLPIHDEHLPEAWYSGRGSTK